MKTKILMTEFVTHDVKRFLVEKPKNYEFTPGQATELNIVKDGLKDEKRPFTFTSQNEDKILEFIIKKYQEHQGVTEQLHKLKPGDEIELGDSWGAITYKGPGVFIAGGAGITPFIAILRQLAKENRLENNKLIFSNKKAKDIILEKEFKEMLKDNAIFTLTKEENNNYDNKKIDKEYLKQKINDFEQHFYICGPPKFVSDIRKHLEELGAKTESLVFEK